MHIVWAPRSTPESVYCCNNVRVGFVDLFATEVWSATAHSCSLTPRFCASPLRLRLLDLSQRTFAADGFALGQSAENLQGVRRTPKDSASTISSAVLIELAGFCPAAQKHKL